MRPENQQQLLAVLDRQAALSLDEICLKLDLPTYRVLPDLLQLELLGYVKALSGRQYLALLAVNGFRKSINILLTFNYLYF